MQHQKKNRLRLFWAGMISVQTGFIAVLLIISVRSVWPLINKSIRNTIGLGDYSFFAVFGFLIGLLLTSAGLGLYLFREKTKPTFRTFFIVFILFQFLLNIAILWQLYPNLKSMYLSQLPYWLFKEGALIISLTISTGLTLFFFRKYYWASDYLLNSLMGAHGILLTISLCFLYVSLTVRSSGFQQNSLQKRKNSQPGYFCVDTETTPQNSDISSIYPTYSIPHDIEFGGDYISAGDLTGDGIVELVTAKYWVEPTDINRIKSISVQSLLRDSTTQERGKTIWTWESNYPVRKNIGTGRGSSAALTVFDLQTGEANNKLLFATDGCLYEFSFAGQSVSQKKVATGAIAASDCLIIANLDGTGKHHLLLKDAYHTIWAYDQHLNLLWKTTNPGGYLLSHRMAACDLNNDGIDEILAGATILNNKGEVISTLKTKSVKLWYGGHIDGIVPIKQKADWKIAVTYCDGLGTALFDAAGNCLWEVTGEHFEYLVGGYFFNTPELKSDFQLVSKIHYNDDNPQVMMNQDGKLLGMFKPSSTLFSADWTGDGYHEIFFQSPATIYSQTDKIADIIIPGTEKNQANIMRVADVCGTASLNPDGVPDILVKSIDDHGNHFIHIYPNLNGKIPVNYTYPGIGWESSSNYFTKYYEYER